MPYFPPRNRSQGRHHPIRMRCSAAGPRWRLLHNTVKVNIKSGGTGRGLAGSLTSRNSIFPRRPLGRATEIKFTYAGAGEAHLHELRSTKATAKIPVTRVDSTLRSSMEDQCSGFNLAISN